MPRFNVLVPVVELVDAADEKAAIAELRGRLGRAGFDTGYADADTCNAFESEDQPGAKAAAANWISQHAWY